MIAHRASGSNLAATLAGPADALFAHCEWLRLLALISMLLHSSCGVPGR